MPAPSQLLIACPDCGAPTPKTRPTCVKCGAELPKIGAFSTSPPPASSPLTSTPTASATVPSDTKEQGLTEIQAALTSEWRERMAAQETPGQDRQRQVSSRIFNLGVQGLYYVGCAVIVALILSFIGIGSLRVLIERILQH